MARLGGGTLLLLERPARDSEMHRPDQNSSLPDQRLEVEAFGGVSITLHLQSERADLLFDVLQVFK